MLHQHFLILVDPPFILEIRLIKIVNTDKQIIKVIFLHFPY